MLFRSKPRLKTGGLCRVCLVEDLSRPGQVIISCRTPIREGMKIVTTNPAIKAISNTNRSLVLQKYKGAIKNPPPDIKSTTSDTPLPDLSQIFSKYPTKKEFTLPLAIDITDALGYVGPSAIEKIANHVGVEKENVRKVVYRYSFLPRVHSKRAHIYLCNCHNCRLKGQPALYENMKSILGDSYEIHRMNWLGVCIHEPPSAMVKIEGKKYIEYLTNVKIENLNNLKNSLESSLVKDIPDRIQFFPYNRLGNNYISLTSDMDIESIAKKAALSQPNEIISKIEAAGLRGCGGAGFPTHIKWRTVLQAKGDKYIICNADEGLPCTFKDGWLLRDKKMLEKVIAGDRKSVV